MARNPESGGRPRGGDREPTGDSKSSLALVRWGLWTSVIGLHPISWTACEPPDPFVR